MRMTGGAGFRLVVAAMLAVGSVASVCSIANAQTRPKLSLFGTYSTVGSPLGTPDFNPLAAMDTQGETTLVWHSYVGPVIGVDTASIAPGHTLAGKAMILNHGASASSPALAEAPSGQAAVAWLAMRRASSKAGAAFLTTALQVSERPAGGRFGAPQTVWSASEPELFPDGPEPEFYSTGEGFLEGVKRPSVQIAINPSGEEAIAWETSRLMVATRRGSEPFTTPVAVGNSMEGPPDEQPAVAVDPSGRVTVMWINKQNEDLLASTWAAGESPSPPTILAHESLPPLKLSVDPAGEELAAWFTRPHNAGGKASPGSVLSVAWRPAAGTFEQEQRLTASGLSVGEPVIALRGDGRALLAWTQVNGEYCEPSGPHGECGSFKNYQQLHYAVGDPGETFSKARTLTPPHSGDASIAASWLADGTALVTWRDMDSVVAAHSNTDGVLEPPRKVVEEFGTGGGSSFAEPSLAAGGRSDAVIAWGREYGDGSVAYALANGLGGHVHSAVAPTFEVLPNVESIFTDRGIPILVRCSERCRLHGTARFVTKHFHRPTGGETFSAGAHQLGLDRVLPAGRTERLRIPASKQLLAKYCNKNDFTGAEVKLSVRGLRSGGLRQVVEPAPYYILGHPHEAGGFCPE